MSIVCGRVEVDDEQFGFPETIRWVMNSFRTRTNWLRSVRVVVDEDVCVVVDNNVCGRVEVDDEQSGFPETIRLVMNSTKTRTIWLRLNRGEVVVADNVNAVIVVDDDQSGLPETIRLCENGPLASYGSNYCIQRKYYIE